MDKTPHIAEEQLVMTMDKTQKTKLKDTKVSISVLSADISKRKEISRWRPIDKTLHYDFSATETFFKNSHITFAEDDEAFPSLCSNCLKIKQSLRSSWTDTHIHTQTHKQTNITLHLHAQVKNI